MSVAENLLALKQVQRDIRAAIESRGVAVGDTPFAGYPALILSIAGGPGANAPTWGGAAVTWAGAPTSWET